VPPEPADPATMFDSVCLHVVILQAMKSRGSRSDGFLVVDFSLVQWVMMAIPAVVGVVSVLHLLASAVRNRTYMHDLKYEVNRLQIEYQTRLREMRESGLLDDEVGEVDIVEDAPLASKAA
jgi:hypothetical protein